MFSKKLVLGYFGDVTNQIDGQTIKTKNVYSLFENDYKNVDKFDTQKLQFSKFSYLLLFYKMLISKYIIWLPGKNNIKGLCFFMTLLIKYGGKKVYLFAVGGWLNEFLNIEEHCRIRTCMKLVKIVYVESLHLKHALERNNFFDKVVLFPNFRIHNFQVSRKDNGSDFRIVFMARVMREKGCDSLFNFIKYFNKVSLCKKVTIDIYGPIDENYRKSFETQLSNNNNISYKGIVEPSQVFEVLSNYDLCILPTYYEGEGFPGTIIDSYIAGVPVLVSNWKFLFEFVNSGISGFVCNSTEEFIEKIEKIIKNDSLLLALKEGALTQAKEYDYFKAKDIVNMTINC